MAAEVRAEARGRSVSLPKDTTSLMINDVEFSYGSTRGAANGGEKKQSLWEWTKAEVACYSKYICPVVLANLIVVVIILAYFGVLK